MAKVRELTFNALRRANIARLPEFKNNKGELAHSKADGSDWHITEWVNATAGEHGELTYFILLAAMTQSLGNCGNLSKKVRRGDLSMEDIRTEIARELSDVVTYCDLLAMRADIDLGQWVVKKFNEVSRRVGSSVTLDVGSLVELERMAVQQKEFDAVDELAKEWRRIQLTPIVDDDYPSVRRDYERAMRVLIEAIGNNGRI